MLTEISSQAQFDEEANKGTSFFTFAPDFCILEINTFPVPIIIFIPIIFVTSQ